MLPALRAIIKTNPGLVNAADVVNQTALHIATAEGALELARFPKSSTRPKHCVRIQGCVSIIRPSNAPKANAWSKIYWLVCI